MSSNFLSHVSVHRIIENESVRCSRESRVLTSERRFEDYVRYVVGRKDITVRHGAHDDTDFMVTSGRKLPRGKLLSH